MTQASRRWNRGQAVALEPLSCRPERTSPFNWPMEATELGRALPGGRFNPSAFEADADKITVTPDQPASARRTKAVIRHSKFRRHDP
jgi:hypothetical protein